MPGARGGSRRAWGWHRLADDWAATIVADAGIRPGELVLDIGAGHGALTAHLVAAGARVIAVERHPDRAARLRERFAVRGVTVIEADALALRLPGRPFRVVASPPYSISAPLLSMLLAPASRLTAADLVLQRAAARRYAGGVGGSSRDGRGSSGPTGGSASGGGGGGRAGKDGSRRWSIGLGRAVPRKAFVPPPQVDSAVLVIRRRW